MRSAGMGMERVLKSLVRVERLLGHLEEHQTRQHVKNAAKEWLLASRSVIDSLIDTLEEDKGPPTSRKINISKE